MKFVRGIMVCLLLSIFARAQDDGAQEHFQRFSVMPVIAYSEETELEYGGLLVLFFKPFEGSAHVSTIDLVALGSIFLLRGLLPIPYEPVLIATAVALSLMSILTAFRYGKKL